MPNSFSVLYVMSVLHLPVILCTLLVHQLVVDNYKLIYKVCSLRVFANVSFGKIKVKRLQPVLSQMWLTLLEKG